MAIRTYYCAGAGVVRRLTDFTLPWVSVDISDGQVVLNDIKSDPTDGDKVFTVGTNNAIYVSSNAGTAWSQPTGGYASFSTTEWYEVWPIDANNIVACGSEGRIALSTDGGSSFDILSSFPTPTGLPVPGKAARAIHFTTDLTGVVGFEDLAFATADGGTTWTALNSGLPFTSTVPGVIAQINGIHLDKTGLVIVVHTNTNIWRSTDGGITFGLPVYTYAHNIGPIFVANGRHLTWYDDNVLWGVGDFNEIVQSTNGGSTWTLQRTTFPTYQFNYAGHFYTITDGFFSQGPDMYSSSDAGVSGTYSDTSGFIENYVRAVWTTAPDGCFQLTNCAGKPIPIIVSDDLSQYVNQFVQIQGECYFVLPAPNCLGSIPLWAPITASFATCCECNPPTCYELRDCTGETVVLHTTNDMSQYVGQTIKVCDFTASPVIPIAGFVVTCTVPNEKGFVTQVTGPTTGFYYESSSGLVKPYTNPLMLTLVVGDQVCVNPASPFDVVSMQTGLWTIQFFLDSTPITTPIIVNTVMPIPTLQYFIDQSIIYPNTTITVNTFDNFNFLNVTVNIKGPIDATEITVTTLSPAGVSGTVTEEFLGGCICYTVFDMGTDCNCGDTFTGVISGVFPDCECCLPQDPPDEEEQYIPTPPEIDKHLYRIPESQCDIDANKAFASAMYDLFKQKQYGIASCCNINLDKAWVEKELSDLSKLKSDPNVCS